MAANELMSKFYPGYFGRGRELISSLEITRQPSSVVLETDSSITRLQSWQVRNAT